MTIVYTTSTKLNQKSVYTFYRSFPSFLDIKLEYLFFIKKVREYSLTSYINLLNSLLLFQFIYDTI
jgi:hypothetical protein